MRWRAASILIAVVVTGVVTAGCGGSENQGTSDTASAEAGPSAQISTGNPEGYGPAIVNEIGDTLYVYGNDKQGGPPTCNGSCAKAWPPLTTGAAPSILLGRKAEPGEPGVHPSLLGMVDRADGTNQVTYAGYPLYTYTKDRSGDANGVGVNAYGAIWYPINLQGKLIDTEGHPIP